MNTLILLAHPEPTSFNARLAEIAAEVRRGLGDRVELVDLNAIGFDPVEAPRHYGARENEQAFSPLAEQRHAWKGGTVPDDVAEQIAHLDRADLVILQFPVWWHSVPAMLKGWMDRVFLSGGLYTSKMRYDAGYFRGKRAICSITSGAPADVFVEGGRGGSLDQILWSTQFSLHYMGFEVLSPQASFGVAGHGYSYVSEADFAAQFADQETAWRSRLPGLSNETPMTFPGWSDWDETGRPLATAER
ncbi:NAD(P)H-dependent oxidoreductase [Pseudooceanicola sp.]|uniref:NAD(P)H-dependent oxidoreductase n=1 Tax=Pseudooceanicola sp. TaxID=1914328 RepID=UPI0035C776E1